MLEIDGFKRFFLSFMAIDHGKVPEFRLSSRKNQGYPPKISSAHSPIKETVFSFFTSLQNRYKEESTSAIPGISLAIIASFKEAASSGVSSITIW